MAMLIHSDGTSLEVTFGSILGFQEAADPSNYVIAQPSDAVPVVVQDVALNYTTIQSGVGFVVSDPETPVVIMEGTSEFSANLTDANGAAMLANSTFSAALARRREAQATITGSSSLIGISNLVNHPEAHLNGESGFLADLTRVPSVFTNLFFPYGAATPIYVGDFISLQSTGNYVPFAKVLVVYSDGTLRLDRQLFLLDPQNGHISWTHTTGLEGVTLTINKPTGIKTYVLNINGLQDLTGHPFVVSQSFVASAPKPQVVSADLLDEGQVVITFSEAMRIDSVLQNPGEYAITGLGAEGPVQVKTVGTISPTQILLTTVGFENGSYQLEVNATGTPHDVAGNPIDPTFNLAVFSGSPALSSRSVFTDHGPITKPALTLQTGSTASVEDATTLYLPTATVTLSMIGKYITLTGTINSGTFRITSRAAAVLPLTGWYVGVVASFSVPDAADGAIVWEIFDPRDGEIADDPSDVTVRVNGSPITADAVIGLLGQIVLPAVPTATDTVDVDYCWICNPVVDFRRLNSKEFRLNNWNRDTGRPTDASQHKYRYNNTLIRPETFVPLDLRAKVDQPLQRDLKYRAYERAYSALLNDPNTFLLNSPTHRIAFPPMSRQVSSIFVNYQATVLPEASLTYPWVRHGTGSASIVGGTDLVVVDNTTGPFPGGNPIFWSRDVDLTFPHVFATAWRMTLDAAPVTEGVFTGVISGYSDDEKAVIVGFLLDGTTKKVGFLKAGAGNDPSNITAWTGGVDSLGVSTGAPIELDWALLHSYRIFRDRSGVIYFYVDGSIVESLRALPTEIPYLEELNVPFDELQGVFFGSISRAAENTSTWSFVRYSAIPLNPLQAAPSMFVSYEGTTPPEEASQPWTPVGFHGTETIVGGDFLLLDSTSATDLPSSSAAGLISGDFKGYSRIEPLLAASFDTILDVNVALRTFTHGITPNAVLAAIDDGDRLMQLCFFPDKAAPKFSYGGRSLPEQFAPYLWNKTGGASASMVGQYLKIEDTSTLDGLVYHLDDAVVDTDPNRIVGPIIDYDLEFRTKVLTYTPDPADFCGVMSQVYDGSRSVGVLLEEVAGNRYVRFHSDGNVLGVQFLFNWFDGEFHTYRATKSTAGNLVSLFVDGAFLGSLAYSSFTASPPTPSGQVSFGSSTSLSLQAQSSVLWAYSNFWRVNRTYDLDPVYGYRRFVGFWKGYDPNALTGYHLPLRTSGRGAAVNGNTLTDLVATFVASGVVVDDQLIVDIGLNKGVYRVTNVTPTVITVDVATPFPFQPSEVDYRIAYQTDWSVPHRYRISKDPSGGLAVYLDTLVTPIILVGYNSIDLPSCSSGIARTIAGNLPSILWGAFDPTNISQTSWDYVRFGAVRSQSELGIVPHHQVLNQRNVMASYEHHRTTIAHTHTDFWSESEGIPPQTEPDLLRDPNLVAFTLLNDGTPLVPSTQTYEVRRPTPVLVPVAGLNRPEDVLNSQGFVLNDAEQKIEIVVPDDVLYNSLKVIESTTGSPGLIAPFSDESQPYDLGTLSFQNLVCLNYDGSVLPEDDSSAPTPWSRVSDDPSHQFATAFAGILRYGTDATGTRTIYRNNTPLPDSISLETEVRFRFKVVQDSSGGLGDSQIRVGLSSPGSTIGLAFVTMVSGERYVFVVDLNNGQTVGGVLFDFLDNLYHDYRLVRVPGLSAIQIFIDS